MDKKFVLLFILSIALAFLGVYFKLNDQSSLANIFLAPSVIIWFIIIYMVIKNSLSHNKAKN